MAVLGAAVAEEEPKIEPRPDEFTRLATNAITHRINALQLGAGRRLVAHQTLSSASVAGGKSTASWLLNAACAADGQTFQCDGQLAK